MGALPGRLLLIDYCVEQRGKLEVSKSEAKAAQDKRELLSKVFVAWRDRVHGVRASAAQAQEL